ncbi:hypothetical protein IFO70_09070 [Phormidium tenue FACHB-886]|nr:hypothetical protein [Phormidium tenue FACHB-886]
MQIKASFQRAAKALASIALSLLILTSIWVLPTQGASAAPLLTLEDLPAGFAPASTAEASGCQMSGEAIAFVFRSSQLTELVCTSSFSLAAATENELQQEMMRQVVDSLLQNPQAFVEQADPTHTKALEILDAKEIGDIATGFSLVEPGIGRTEIVLFRRGDFLNSVLVRYEANQTPIASLTTIAHLLDQRTSSLLPANSNPA